jgi:hypothetical protein
LLCLEQAAVSAISMIKAQHFMKLIRTVFGLDNMTYKTVALMLQEQKI